MEITYKSICEKLGFDPLNWQPTMPKNEWLIDDSIKSPFDDVVNILTEEESEFLAKLLERNRMNKQ